MGTSVQRRRNAAKARVAGLGESSIAPAPSARRPSLGESSATHASSKRCWQKSRRLAMNYKNLTTWIIVALFIFALTASALHLFKNDANRNRLGVSIPAV